jgi:CheY-like chemotaxis protein
MLVDDDPAVRELLRTVLPVYGFAVCAEAENGPEALETVKAAAPDVIILDLSMPVLKGLSLADLLLEKMPKVPFLLYSEYTGAALSQRAKEVGPAIVLDKNDPMDALMRRLQDLVAWEPLVRQPHPVARPGGHRNRGKTPKEERTYSSRRIPGRRL